MAIIQLKDEDPGPRGPKRYMDKQAVARIVAMKTRQIDLRDKKIDELVAEIRDMNRKINTLQTEIKRKRKIKESLLIGWALTWVMLALVACYG